MRVIVTEENQEIKLTKELEEALKVDFVSTFTTWYADQITNCMIKRYEKMREAVFLDIYAKNKVNEELILLPQVYEQFHTMKSNIWKSNFANYDMMFNVGGKSMEDQTNAIMQKANIVQALTEMKFNMEADKALDNYLLKGEAIFYCGWEIRMKRVRRKETIEEPILDPFTGQQMSSQTKTQVTVKEVSIFDGPKVTSVDPLCMVYDKSQVDNFDDAKKIIQHFATVQEITDDKVYSQLFDKETKATLEAMVKASKDEPAQLTDEELDGVRGDQIELLEVWGDFIVDDELIRNYIITLAGRKKIIRFEPNPINGNPFVRCPFMPDPTTTRGQSPLAVAVPINQVSSNILNSQVRALKFIVNPAYMVPSGTFPVGRTPIMPGGTVEYEVSNGGKAPEPIPFRDALVGFDFLQFFETKVESATGVFKYMVGAQDSRSRTATETSALVTGQNTRLSMVTSNININLVVPTVEKVADLMADMRIGEENQVKTQNSVGQIDFNPIDDTVRQGNYEYTYGDSQSVVEAEAKMKKLADMLGMFADRVNINWEEFAKLVLGKMNVEHSDTLLKPDPIDVALVGLQPQARDSIKEVLVQYLPLVMEQMQANNTNGMAGNTNGLQGQVKPRGQNPPGASSGTQNAPALSKPNFPGATPVY